MPAFCGYIGFYPTSLLMNLDFPNPRLHRGSILSAALVSSLAQRPPPPFPSFTTTIIQGLAGRRRRFEEGEQEALDLEDV